MKFAPNAFDIKSRAISKSLSLKKETSGVERRNWIVGGNGKLARSVVPFPLHCTMPMHGLSLVTSLWNLSIDLRIPTSTQIVCATLSPSKNCLCLRPLHEQGITEGLVTFLSCLKRVACGS